MGGWSPPALNIINASTDCHLQIIGHQFSMCWVNFVKNKQGGNQIFHGAAFLHSLFFTKHTEGLWEFIQPRGKQDTLACNLPKI